MKIHNNKIIENKKNGKIKRSQKNNRIKLI